MKKKVFVPIIAVLILAIFSAAWYFTPKTFAKGINPDDIDYFSVFDGQTGTGFQVTDPVYVKMIVRNLQNTVLRRSGISLGRMGYGFSVEGVDRNGKSIIPILFINDSSTIRKDPFFYSCSGELCFDFLKELEPDLSAEASLPADYVLQGTVVEIADGTMIVEPLEGSRELSSCDQFSVPVENMNAAPEPEVGDRVEIIYDGSIEETYPARFGQIIHIDVIKSSAGSEEKADDMPDDTAAISIDGVTYFGIGLPIPEEPDESVIEYVEIPAGHGDVTITAFARMEEGKMIACLIDGEWYRFHSMEALASSQINPEK